VKFEARREKKISTTSIYATVEIGKAVWPAGVSLIGGGEEWSFYMLSFGTLYFGIPHIRLSSTSLQRKRFYRSYLFAEMAADKSIKKVEDVLSATAVVGFEAVGIGFEDAKRIACPICLLPSADKI